MLKVTDKYEDIIYREHPTSAKHPRMDIGNRAAQFSPFAALTGYEEAIDETARLNTELRNTIETERIEDI